MLLNIKEMEVRELPFAENMAALGLRFFGLRNASDCAAPDGGRRPNFLPHTGGEVRVKGKVEILELETECDRC